jgi:hypothetical protein
LALKRRLRALRRRWRQAPRQSLLQPNLKVPPGFRWSPVSPLRDCWRGGFWYAEGEVQKKCGHEAVGPLN